MRPEESLEIRDALEPPWDEVREQRVLAGVLEAKRRAGVQPRRFVVAGALAGVAAVAALVFFFLRGAAPVRSPAPVAENVPQAEGEQRMALADGSQAVLLHDARVQVDEQRADRVRLVQSAGTVRYEVRPDASREFVVRAAGTMIRVRGTIFTVDMSASVVEVHVQRGRVEVGDGTRTRDLVAGESLRVPRAATNGTSATADDIDTVADAATPRRPPVDVRPAVPSPSALLDRADDARVAGRDADAASALETLVALYPRDARVPGALFTLGRVERSRARHAASAAAFERCLSAAPKGPLADDALAEAAVSWSAASEGASARSDAQRYLAQHPDGSHAARMRAILSP